MGPFPNLFSRSSKKGARKSATTPSMSSPTITDLTLRKAPITVNGHRRSPILSATDSNHRLCKPRTTDLRPWLWGAALIGRSEHSPRSNRAGYGTHRFLTTDLERGSSLHLRTGRFVVRGKPARFLEKPSPNFGKGLVKRERNFTTKSTKDTKLNLIQCKPRLLRRAQSRWGFQRGEAASLPFGRTRGFKPRV